MKTRESGMPEEGLWATFFTPEEVLRTLGPPSVGDVVDFGCGYSNLRSDFANLPTRRKLRAIFRCRTSPMGGSLLPTRKMQSVWLKPLYTCRRISVIYAARRI